MAEMSFTEYTEADNNFRAAACEIIGFKTFIFYSEVSQVTSRHTAQKTGSLRKQTRP